MESRRHWLLRFRRGEDDFSGKGKLPKGLLRGRGRGKVRMGAHLVYYGGEERNSGGQEGTTRLRANFEAILYLCH